MKTREKCIFVHLVLIYRNYAKDSCTIFFYLSLFGATQWSFGLIFLPNHLLNAPRVPKGDWGSGGTHSTQFQGFWVRPWGFGCARGQNLSNMSIFDLKMPSLPPVTLGHPGCVQWAKILKILSVFLSFLAQSALNWSFSTFINQVFYILF